MKIRDKIKNGLATIVLTGSSVLGTGCASNQNFSNRSDSFQDIHSRGEGVYSQFTPKQTIKQIKTPEQTQHYLDTHLKYSKGETICLDYAIAAAATLSDDGYEPIILGMTGPSGKHAVFPYVKDGKIGALGNTPRPTRFSSINSLVSSLGDYDVYFIFSMDNLYKRSEWVNGNINLKGRKVDDNTKFREVRKLEDVQFN